MGLIDSELKTLCATLASVEDEIKVVNRKIDGVEESILAVEASISDKSSNVEDRQYFRDEKMQLRDKEKQLRDKENQLRDKEKFLRENKRNFEAVLSSTFGSFNLMSLSDDLAATPSEESSAYSLTGFGLRSTSRHLDSTSEGCVKIRTEEVRLQHFDDFQRRKAATANTTGKYRTPHMFAKSYFTLVPNVYSSF